MKAVQLQAILFGFGLLCSSARASSTVLATQTFSEDTSFENLVKEGERLSRAPASNELKFRVIAVRRELGLTEAEARRAPQDVVINGGQGEGIEQGMMLTVVRKVQVIDPYLENQQKELEIKFATVKVIHVQDGLAIARVERMDSIQDGPSVGVRGVLIGDFLSTR
ncbi:MAG: FlgT C-terminal domain-containing protein [Bdellovibrionota bacterium]